MSGGDRPNFEMRSASFSVFGSDDGHRAGFKNRSNIRCIRVHRFFHCVSSPEPRGPVLATEIFSKISVASVRMHLLLIKGHIHEYLMNRSFCSEFYYG